jgi:hypothetical protein
VNDSAKGSSKTGGTILASVAEQRHSSMASGDDGERVVAPVSLTPPTKGITLDTTHRIGQGRPQDQLRTSPSSTGSARSRVRQRRSARVTIDLSGK